MAVVGVAEVVGTALEVVSSASEVVATASELEDEGGVDEENVGTSPPTLTGAEVGWTSTEVETTALDEDVATLLLTRLLEVGFLALQRLTTRFLGTTVGVTAAVSGSAFLAVMA